MFPEQANKTPRTITSDITDFCEEVGHHQLEVQYQMQDDNIANNITQAQRQQQLEAFS